MFLAMFTTAFRNKVDKKHHINWLNWMLWGGVAMLAIEHVAHGEIVPYAPFLSAMSNAADTATMLQEMATVGTGMMLAIVAAWAVLVWVDRTAAFSKDRTTV